MSWPDDLSTGTVLFTAASGVTAAGLIAMPALVLRYLPLTRVVRWWGAVFLLATSLTYLALSLLLVTPPWYWIAEYVVLAVSTWGFIITFNRMLRAATSHRRARSGGGGEGS